MADEGGVEGGSGDIETRESIEKAKTDKVSPDKAPESTESRLGRKPS
jgi:hypothetical protein